MMLMPETIVALGHRVLAVSIAVIVLGVLLASRPAPERVAAARRASTHSQT